MSPPTEEAGTRDPPPDAAAGDRGERSTERGFLARLLLRDERRDLALHLRQQLLRFGVRFLDLLLGRLDVVALVGGGLELLVELLARAA